MSTTIRYRVSIGLNVLLAAVIAGLVLYWSDDASARAAASKSAGVAIKQKTISDQAIAPSGARLAFGPESRRHLVDELRAQGVPENVLARFALADIEENWAGRFEACRGDQDKLTSVQLEHDMGLDAEMRSALGERAFRQWDQKNMIREAMLGSKMQLTADEANAIYDLKKKLQQRQWQLEQARQRGEMDDATISAASNKAFTEYGLGMKTAMGEARYAEAMRGDDGTSALKDNLAKVNASDAQFQQLLTLQRQMSDRRAALDKEFQEDPSSELYAQRIKTFEEEQQQEYRRVLGDSAFETLQKEQDGSYMKMRKFGGIWGLDDSKIDSVYGAIKYYQKSAEDYQDQAHVLEAQGQAVDWSAVDKNLQQLAEQTQQRLQKELGSERYKSMQQNGVFPFAQQPTHRAPSN